MRSALLLLVMTTCHAADYHLSLDGDDTASGTSAETAWASWDRLRAHVDEHGLQPGDRVLLRAGDRFETTGQLTLALDRCGGTAEAPVVISGDGGRATIAVGANHGIMLWAGRDMAGVGGHVHLSDLELIGDGRPKADGGGNATGIMVWTDHPQPIPDIRIERVAVRGFAGNGIEAGRGDHAGRLQDLLIADCATEDNTGAAGVSPHSGSGIVVGGGERAVIERCRSARNGERNDNPGGPIGIWFWDSIDSVIRDCVSHDNRSIHGDGGGFDLDGGCQRCVIERCLSANNVGAGYLFAQYRGAWQRGPLEDNVVRYCVSVDDGRQDGYGGFTFWGAGGKDVVGPNLIHHCTVIATRKPAGTPTSCVRVWPGASPENVVFRDCLFVAGDGMPLFADSLALGPERLRFEGCAWLTAPGERWWIKRKDGAVEDLTAWQATGMAPGGLAGESPWPLPIDLDALRIDPALLSELALLRLPADSPLRAGTPLAEPATDLGGHAIPAGAAFVGACYPPAE